MAKNFTDAMYTHNMELPCNPDSYPVWYCSAYGIVHAGGSDAEKAVNAVLKKIEALENEGRNLREERDQMEYSRLKRKYGEYA